MSYALSMTLVSPPWGQIVRREREDKNLRLRDAAKGCRVAPHVFAAWEAGEGYPSGFEATALYGLLPRLKAHAEALRTERSEARALQDAPRPQRPLRVAPVLAAEAGARVHAALLAGQGQDEAPAPPHAPTLTASLGELVQMPRAARGLAPARGPVAAPGEAPAAATGRRTPFAQALRAARDAAGLTRTQLADLLRVSHSRPGSWEDADGTPTVALYTTLLELFPALTEAEPPARAEPTEPRRLPPSPSQKREPSMSTAPTFAELLRQQRAAKNWTRDQAAEAIGVSPVTLGRWEQGGALQDDTKIAALFRVFPELEQGPPPRKKQSGKSLRARSAANPSLARNVGAPSWPAAASDIRSLFVLCARMGRSKSLERVRALLGAAAGAQLSCEDLLAMLHATHTGPR